MQFESDKHKIKIHNIKEQRFTQCHNCEKIIEDKEVLVNKTTYITIFKV